MAMAAVSATAATQVGDGQRCKRQAAPQAPRRHRPRRHNG